MGTMVQPWRMASCARGAAAVCAGSHAARTAAVGGGARRHLCKSGVLLPKQLILAILDALESLACSPGVHEHALLVLHEQVRVAVVAVNGPDNITQHGRVPGHLEVGVVREGAEKYSWKSHRTFSVSEQ